MSASLVGSEMCIRDSALAAAPAAVRLLLLPRSPQLSFDRSSCRGCMFTCLLYTSDAADDM
eukprot:3363902-Alexandrium_andersonii.AAC.1